MEQIASNIHMTTMSHEHLDAIIQLQHNLMPKKKHWSKDEAQSYLTDSAHRQGENVILAWDSSANKLLGIGAWIIGSQGESFAAPFLAATKEAAVIILIAIEKEARNGKAKWLRVITSLPEIAKSQALDRRGFKRSFEFVEFEIDPTTKITNATKMGLQGLVPVSLDCLDYKKYIEVGNLAFKDVDNALPLTESDARDIWENGCDRELSQVLASADDNYVGFTIVTPKGYIDSVGVHPDHHGKGIARNLYQHVINTAAARGMSRLHTVVSSRNIQSLRLHEKMGFHESERRQVWEFGKYH